MKETKNKKEKIAAVVVTYNRKQLLKECLDALLSQTYPLDLIIIIDNASRDMTPEFLNEQHYLDNPKIDYVRLPENTGAGGGFYEGIKRAYEKDFDWLWLMDDDGKPEPTSLEKLIIYKDKADFIAPLVVSIENQKKLSFGIVDYESKKIIRNIYQITKNIYENTANPFNGILISRKLIENVGFPLKELFIKGDEYEYFLRVIYRGYKVITVTEALFYHPASRDETGFLNIVWSDNNLRKYCHSRNHAYIFRRYNKVALMKFLGGYLLFFIFYRKFDVKGLLFFIKAVLDGLFGIWGKEKKYLK